MKKLGGCFGYFFRQLTAFAGIAMVFTWAPSAGAGSVVLEDVGFIKGVDGITTPFTVTYAGEYEALLVDFEFPTAFESLSLQITQGVGFDPLTGETSEIGRLSGEGSFTFYAEPGNYFANVLGDAGGNLDIGLYGFKLTQLTSPVATAVPLPSAVFLFLTSILLLATFVKLKNNLGEVTLFPRKIEHNCLAA